MKRINAKYLSLGMLVLPLLGLLFVQAAAHAQNYTPEEQNCHDLVQGKVAWNTAGNTGWDETNVRNLCKGTTNANATVTCFRSSISSGQSWDKAIPACTPPAFNPPAAPNPAPAAGGITRTITLKNNGGVLVFGALYMLVHGELLICPEFREFSVSCYDAEIVRPERRVVLAGGSPARVSAGAPGSRLQPGGEIRPSRAECQKP